MINKKGELYQFIERIKFVRAKDIFSIAPMIVGFFISVLIKPFHKNLWLFCERKNEARDNGYWFFKYMCENHKEIECVYAINKKAIDYQKVKPLGKVIQFGSFVHWIYYFVANKNLSSQKEGKPNAAICFILEVYFGARKNRVYLKHGIIKDNQRWIYYDVTKMNLLLCAAQREYQFILKNFGYPNTNVRLTGLCRYDNLLTQHVIKKQILVMPTMREWLRIKSTDTFNNEHTYDFCQSTFYLTWSSFLHNEELKLLLDKYDFNLIFYLHPSMQKYANKFLGYHSRIKSISDRENDVQTLLLESKILITDYSSVFFDFAYMKKPLIYYQFDYEQYRNNQYQEGYFSYEHDGFGPVVMQEVDLLNIIKQILENGVDMPSKYKARSESFFEYHDSLNCLRTYNAVMSMRG